MHVAVGAGPQSGADGFLVDPSLRKTGGDPPESYIPSGLELSEQSGSRDRRSGSPCGPGDPNSRVILVGGTAAILQAPATN